MTRPRVIQALLREHLAVGTFGRPDEVTEAIARLRAAGFDPGRLALLADDPAGAARVLDAVEGGAAVTIVSPVTLSQQIAQSGAEEVAWAALGILLAVTTFLVLLAAPGLGPVLQAAGPAFAALGCIFAAMFGFGFGTILGAIVDDRDSTARCQDYEAALSRGAWLLVAHGQGPETKQAARVLADTGAERVETY